MITEMAGIVAAPRPTPVVAHISNPEGAYLVLGFPPGTIQPAWLTTYLGIHGPNATQPIEIGVNNAFLQAGTYTVPVRVALARADASVIGYRDIDVTYRVVWEGIQVLPDTWALSASAAAAAPQLLPLNVDGTLGLSWTASVDSSWLSLSDSSGQAGTTTHLTVNPAGLAVGEHVGMATFAGASMSYAVQVTLRVAP
jgi:hypothetical protein